MTFKTAALQQVHRVVFFGDCMYDCIFVFLYLSEGGLISCENALEKP
jgi:hypothetical protein